MAAKYVSRESFFRKILLQLYETLAERIWLETNRYRPVGRSVLLNVTRRFR